MAYRVNHVFFVTFSCGFLLLLSILIGFIAAESTIKGNLGSDNTTTQTPPTTSTSPTPTTKPVPPIPPTTPIPPTPKPTVPPSPPTTSSPSPTTPSPPPNTTPDSPHDRSFDLPSFIGGVILSLGLAAICYVVYKFYKTRTDPNYRTL